MHAGGRSRPRKKRSIASRRAAPRACSTAFDELGQRLVPRVGQPRARAQRGDRARVRALREQGRAHGQAVVAAITRQAIGQLVDELEDLGYVQRTTDPADGRAQLVLFTRRGRAMP
jgi:hypothetical protein